MKDEGEGKEEGVWTLLAWNTWMRSSRRSEICQHLQMFGLFPHEKSKYNHTHLNTHHKHIVNWVWSTRLADKVINWVWSNKAG